MAHTFAFARRGIRQFAFAVATTALGCGNDRVPPGVLDPPEASDTPPADSLPSDSVPTVEPPADSLPPDSLPPDSTPPDPGGGDPPAFQGIPFGFFRMDYALLGEDWNSLKRVAMPDSVRRDLDIARSRGARVFVQFAQSHHHYQNPDGSFNLDKFKQMLDRYQELDLDSYVADGTIAGHFLLDEPNDPSNWGGRGLPYEMIEAAAEHSKLLWPTLPALIRSRPSWLAKAPFRWRFLDGGWSQYVTRFGDVERFRDVESQAARQAGLMVVWGLNVLDGGDGSSRKTGTKPNRYTMSPAELRRYGETLIGVPGSCGFLLWRYDSGYVSDGAVLSALKSLRDQARSLPLQSCLRAQ